MAVLGLLAALALRSKQYSFGVRTLLASLIICLLGIWLTLDGAARVKAGIENRDWPTVPGVVIEARVEGSRAFHPVIVYEYSVNGAVFRDSSALQQPSFGGRRRRKEVAETETEQYTPGQDVIVYFDPEDPSRSNLGRFLHWSDYGRTGTGGILFGVGCCFLLLYLFGKNRRRALSG
jgi:hypothetical protein